MCENSIEIYEDELPTLSAPSEVLEHIFGFLDGRTFCFSRLVCKTWNEIIKSMQRNRKVWKRFCLREIPTKVLEEILWFKSYRPNDIDWMSIYKKWYSGKMILKSPCWKKKISALYANPITCVRISGSWIITGHNNGLLCVWNLLTGALSQSFMCHLKVIKDMALVDLLNLGTYYGSEEHPWSHHHIITISKDRYIHVMSLLEPMVSTDSDVHLNHHTDDLNEIRVFDDKFAVSCSDNTVTVYSMKTQMSPYFHLEVSEPQKIMGPKDYVMCLSLWRDKVLCLSHAAKLREFVPNNFDWVLKKQYQESCPGDSTPNIVAPNYARLFRKHTMVMIGGDCQIILSVGLQSPVHWFLMPHLGTGIVSVALHGTIFAMGAENGKLFLYHVANEKQLMHTDLAKPDFALYLSEASIIAIDISYQYDSPVIVACSNENIYVIKWYSKKNVAQIKKNEKLKSILGHVTNSL